MIGRYMHAFHLKIQFRTNQPKQKAHKYHYLIDVLVLYLHISKNTTYVCKFLIISINHAYTYH